MTTWIFQGNPKRFKVDEYLSGNDEIVWTIRQKHYVDDIQVGDTVYIWRSEAGKKGYGGIVARTTVTSTPVSGKDVTSQYRVIPNKANEILPRVPLNVEELALDNHLNRDLMKKNKILSNLLILKMSNSTNYKVTESQAEELLQQWTKIQSSNSNNTSGIPVPNPVSRNREFLLYSEQQRNEVVYEYVFNGNTHRWITRKLWNLILNGVVAIKPWVFFIT